MKKILYITTEFYPSTRTSAIRATKLVKYLSQLGYEVIVFSPKLNVDDKTEEIINKDGFNNVTSIKIQHSIFYERTFLKIRNDHLKNAYKDNTDKSVSSEVKTKIKQRLTSYSHELYSLIQAFDWNNQVVKYLRNNFEKFKCDFVLTSYPRLATLLIGHQIMKKGLATRWIIDFRDPMAYKSLSSQWYYKLNKKMQAKFIRQTDAVLHVSQEMKITLSEGIEDINKLYYLPNGFDTDELQLVKKSQINLNKEFENCFLISYVGSLYGGKRDITVLFEKIRMLEKSKAVKRDNIKFIYAGKDFKALYIQAKKYALEDILINKGIVPREDSLSIQYQSDLIIVNNWNTKEDKGLVPGKIYECFLLQKPILAIINGDTPNSELGKMTTKSGLGIKYETMISDEKMDQSLLNFLKTLYNSKMNKQKNNLKINYEYLDNFNYTNITKQLDDILAYHK